MITANTKVTAKEVLQEVGINDMSVFGTMRVRIGGIPGINEPDRVINISPEAKTIEVIVGNELYELELAKGTKDDNADIATVSEEAQKAIEAKGAEASEKAEHLQQVKKLADKLRQAQNDGFAYKPTPEEKLILDEATEKAEADRANLEANKGPKPDAIKVKSK